MSGSGLPRRSAWAAIFALSTALGCARETSIIVTIEDPGGWATSASRLALGREAAPLLETRPLPARGLPVTVALTAPPGESGLLHVEARDAEDRPLARGSTPVTFEASRSAGFTVALGRACDRDDPCSDGLFCTGQERCEDGVCRPGEAPCGALALSCVRSVCLEAEGTCSIELAEALDDGDSCTLDLCEGEVLRHEPEPGREGTPCASAHHEGFCVAGRCNYCGDSAIDPAREVCDPPVGDCLECRAVRALGALVSVGFMHTCRASAEGSLSCWGINTWGSLGDGTNDDAEFPRPVAGLDDVRGVAAASYGTCVLREEGSVLCWGENATGAVGDGSRDEATRPVRVFEGATRIARERRHACAIHRDGSLWCWGANNAGQIGSAPPGDDALSPERVPGLQGVTSVATGLRHTCAVEAPGRLSCWGSNVAGQLGDGTLEARPTPTPVPRMEDVLEVSANGEVTCALRRDGSLWCWGSNSLGQLGDGGAPSRTMPGRVPGLANVHAVSVGDEHACALLGDGSAWCWGGGDYGQNGDPSFAVRLSPTLVLDDVKSLDTGVWATCAVRSDDGIWCWGNIMDPHIGVTAEPTRIRERP